MRRIYFDNAATTPLDPEVLEAMLPYMREHFGNPSAIHAYGRKTCSSGAGATYGGRPPELRAR
ncbi:MAG: aminotransferase class V-fold PLP-dependent enzyme [Flavobacteriales bacterium]